MNYREYFFIISAKYNTALHKHFFLKLPVPVSCQITRMELSRIELPYWASDVGVGYPPSIVFPTHCSCGDKLNWENIDWFRAVFDFTTLQAEYLYERNNKPVHSYASRLPKPLSGQWSHAWVNRMILFLRRWVAYNEGISEKELFGEKPKARIYLSHDVDYVHKTIALRLKTSFIYIYNCIRLLSKGKISAALKNTKKLLWFNISQPSYWQFSKITKNENEFGVKSIWNFYAGKGGYKRSLSELLFDPAYKVWDEKISAIIKHLRADGHQIGLHQGFHSWKDSNRMSAEKKRLENSLGAKVAACRQHWLRFSFSETWKAQESAGFKLDTTLGFNEIPGFRNGAALKIPAWIFAEKRFSSTLDIIPMVLMDSHLFDYGQMSIEDRRKTIDHILDEVAFVGGTASIIWHQRVFNRDYNWGDDYRYLLENVKKKGLQCSLL